MEALDKSRTMFREMAASIASLRWRSSSSDRALGFLIVAVGVLFAAIGVALAEMEESLPVREATFREIKNNRSLRETTLAEMEESKNGRYTSRTGSRTSVL